MNTVWLTVYLFNLKEINLTTKFKRIETSLNQTLSEPDRLLGFPFKCVIYIAISICYHRQCVL